MRHLIAVLLLALAGACAYPETTVTMGRAPGSIYFVDVAEPGAEVFVDGLARGRADRYDGKKAVLQVSAGRHVVELRSEGKVLLRRNAFVAEGARVEIR
jgi:hypothetical protein